MRSTKQAFSAIGLCLSLAALILAAYSQSINSPSIIIFLMGAAAIFAAGIIAEKIDYTVIAYTDDTERCVIINARPITARPAKFPKRLTCDGVGYTFKCRSDSTNAIYEREPF